MKQLFGITIIHPSRSRAKMCFETINKWIENASKTVDIQYILSVDVDDPELSMYDKYLELLVSSKAHEAKVSYEVKVSDNKSAIQAINNCIPFIKNNLIIVVSDDFDCFLNWDLFLKTNLEDKEDFIVKTYDGIQEWLITLPIMDRKYLDRFGYIYYPEYKHLFCDTEMTSVADLLGRKINLSDPACPFRHLHPCAGLSVADDINKKNDATWAQGETLYYQRKENNFGLSL